MNNKYGIKPDNTSIESDYANAVSRGRQWRDALQRLLWWAAGKSTSIMRACAESVRVKYSAIGVWLTCVVPVIAGFAMAEFLTDLHFGTLGVVFGSVFWSLAIHSLERMLLTCPNGPDKVKNWLRAIPRFAIALCVSYLITETLICMAFSGEIRAEMATYIDEAVIQKGNAVRTEQEARITILMTEDKQLKARRDELFNLKRDAETAMHNEADGTGGTFTEGEGNHFQMRKEAFQRATSEYEAERPLVEDKIKTNEAALASLESDVKKAESEKQTIESDANGLLARHESLMRIIASRPSAATLYCALMLFLILVETIALLQKLIAESDEYDDRLKFEIQRQALSATAQFGIQTRILTAAGEGSPNTLPEKERSVGERTYDGFIRNAADRLIGRRSLPGVVDEFSDTIRLEIVDHDELKAALRLPRSEMSKITLDQLAPEFDRIGTAISEEDGYQYRLERAENSLGLEIWPDAPLVAQLEQDRLARLRFARNDLDFGLRG